MSYWRFGAMIATSTLLMFGLMYLNTYLWAHLFFSETRAYMALLMGATMAIVMLAFMLSMYTRKGVNAAIFAGAAIVFGVSLWLVRSQVTVGDTSFMRAMIPHHSIAIMTSGRVDLSDPRVRKLAREIVYAQDKEIAEMRYLIADIANSGDAAAPESGEPARLASLREALSTANVAVLDPEFMSAQEIGRVFPDGAACTFAYTADSPPVFAADRRPDGASGAIKISGDLVRLDSDADFLTRMPRLTAAGVTVRIAAPGGAALDAAPGKTLEADLLVDLDAGLSAGFRGFYTCRD
tara:strand:+ start:244 stop:1125 length:882 start_codon:yes stop_codon:yes gene_type:complete